MRICMASDFCYPNKGGVEVHIHSLAQQLARLGHHVVVITHARPGHHDVRYFRPGFKIYYCPFLSFANGITAPTLFLQMPLIRDILLRERVQLVHSHQSASPLAVTVALAGRQLGCGLVHTEHSLFGTDDLASININKLFKTFMSDYDRFIAVSSVTRQNLVIRGMLPPRIVHRIPNAIDTDLFYPRPELRRKELTLVFLCRLVYRKGVDLLADLLPLLAQDFPEMRFIVAGGGPKQKLIRTVVHNAGLQDRVEISPLVEHSKVPELLNQGHIFLNTSLTESFCMAVLEAGACGLISVSTNVGGISEIIPQDYLVLAPASVPPLREAVAKAVAMRTKLADLWAVHGIVKQCYNWGAVARQVERVYELAVEDGLAGQLSIGARKRSISRYFTGGLITGLLMLFILAWLHLQSLLLWTVPPLQPTHPKQSNSKPQPIKQQNSKQQPHYQITNENNEKQ